MNFRTLIILALSASVACQETAPRFELDYGVDSTDDGDDGDDAADSSQTDSADRDSSHFDAPEVIGETLTVTEGESLEVGIDQIVRDADTPLNQLSVTVASSTHVSAVLDGQILTLGTRVGWTGTEELSVEVEDPTELSTSGFLEVEVVSAEVDPPDEPAPARSCETTVTYDTFDGSATQVGFASELNGWQTDDYMTTTEAGLFEYSAVFPAGRYAYKLIRDGEWILDPGNPYRTELEGETNSLLTVPNCTGPLLTLTELDASAQSGTLRWVIGIEDSPEQPGIDLETVSITVNREAVAPEAISASLSELVITLADLQPGRYTLRATISDVEGAESELFFAPTWLEDNAFEWQDAVLYFTFVDRFRNGDTSNDAPAGDGVAAIGSWLGGDYAGITQALADGYFDDLGVTALWISAPNDNPDESVIGDEGYPVTAYHGYFPSAARDTENHFGSLEELRTLTETAHQHGIRVIADLVANHVYEDHAYYSERQEGEFNSLELCRDIDWARPLTCWFEPYLPDFDYGRLTNVERTVEDALWWVEQADIDGFRIDAVKHMDHNVSYRLRAETDHLYRHANTDMYLLGETFTGLWSEDVGNQLAEYVSDGELHGQFDFPLYWEVVRTLARQEEGFVGFGALEAALAAFEARFGPGNLMGTFIGNHDVPRFASHANGDIGDMWGNGSKLQGWTDPPSQPEGAAPYRQLEIAFAWLLTSPGVPTIYYGDEIGLAGAGDPDNRRFYPWSSELSEAQSHLHEWVSYLGRQRTERVELRRGEREVLLVEGSHYVYARILGDAVTLVALNNGPSLSGIEVDLSAWLDDGTILNGRGDGGLTVTGGRVSFDLAEHSSALFSTEE